MHTNVQNINADFTCKNCGVFVSAQSAVSGVVHRNHCPYCLHSQHVDLFKAGDRLCACKSLMAPVGLTLKRSRDKYANRRGGEVMLVHRCTHCNEIVINRIAADDDPAKLLGLMKEGSRPHQPIIEQCQGEGIRLIEKSDRNLVLDCLFGEKGYEPYQKCLTVQII
jgi:hypothetical protein